MSKRKRSSAAINRRRVKRKATRKFVRAVRRQIRTETNIQRGPNPFGQRAIAKLKYVERINLVGANNICALYYIRANSMFDPNETGVGHQPMGFDQYATLFHQYRVFKVAYRFVCMPLGAQSGSRMAIGFQNNGTAWPTSMDAIAEKPRTFVKTLAYDGPTTIKGKFYLPRAMGMTPEQYRTDPETAAAISTNPLEFANIVLAYECPATTNQTLYTDLYLTYYVEFFDPKALAQS